VNRRPLIAGNWKMHKTVAETRALLRELRAAELPHGVQVVAAPPFTALFAAHEELRGSPIELGAQTMHQADSGPFTGEISPVMLRELGVAWVILGHSERRAYCNENDDDIALKVRAALAHGITPIVAVGETATEHERNETIGKVTFQIRAAFAVVPAGDVAKCVVAYEPIWAIGTGVNDEPESANAVIAEIRSAVDGLQGARILYGGSMKPDNASALMAQPEIDGGLVGGASLSAKSFLAIVAAAHSRFSGPRPPMRGVR
jgi:triosephosphate isomerase